MATWRLDPAVTHLNHGSFGACPVEVLDHQRALRERLEANPVAFMLREYQPLLEAQRDAIAEFLNAERDGLVFVPNATYGVNSVLRSWESVLVPGDEILVTDHAYNACRNAVEVTAARTGAVLRTVEIPLPVSSPVEITSAVLNAVTDRTALVMVDHITSPTGLVQPVGEIVEALEPAVPVLVDGAHAPGMVPVDLTELGASFYTANCHKWLCAPKGAAVLHVAERHRSRVEAVSISHGHNGQWPASGSDFHARFDWTGTDDPTARLSVAAALEVMAAHDSGGWPGLRSANHALVLEGRTLVADALGTALVCPDDMVGSIAAVQLPDSAALPAIDDLTSILRERWQIEVPCFGWSKTWRFVRISAQVYNELADYERLVDALTAEFAITV